MIQIQRQLIADRKLVINSLKHHHLDFNCQPHQIIHFKQIQIIFNQFIQQLNRLFNKFQIKLVEINTYIKQIGDIVKYKINNKLQNIHQQAIFNQISPSAQCYKTNSTKVKTQFHSAGHKIKSQQPIKFSNPSQTKQYATAPHNYPTISSPKQQPIIPHSDYQQNFLSNQPSIEPTKYFETTQIPQFHPQIQNKSQQNSSFHYQLYRNLPTDQRIQWLQSTIKQYQQQDKILRKKQQKYRNGLKHVLSWLKNFKQVQLKACLPCQHCQLLQQLSSSYQQNSSPPKTQPPKIKQLPSFRPVTNMRDQNLISDE